jgi:electron transport complex protein RnfA
MEYILILIGAILVNNIVLTKFLGLCPFFGVSKKLSTALGMGGAVIFVMTLSTIVTWLFQHYLLKPFNLEYLQTVTFILIIAALVQIVELVVKKTSPSLYQALGIYLPLITTNCTILGVAILAADNIHFNLLQATTFAIGNGLGFTLAIWLISSIRERLDLADVPEGLQGIPIAFITAGILAMAFMGFSGLVK